ncbi:MAG: rRNA pseudouridine synthase [Tannerella sp.]|jgi:23S rRNA pseudouridine2605 synthase|nr:rRNA pseudouridine synthase [Tannerella sp.]
MDFTEKNESKATSGNEFSNSENLSSGDHGLTNPAGSDEKPKGKRLRIKDTRKVDYNKSAPVGRPYQPVYGQTRQSSSYQQRPYPSQDGEDMPQRRQHTGENDSDNRYYSGESGSGNYQRRSYNQPGEQGGYPQRNYHGSEPGGYPQRNYSQGGEQGGYPQRNYNQGGQGGYQQKRSYDSQGSGYQQRRSYDQGGSSRPPGGGYQQRGYNQNSGYNQSGGYSQGGGYNQNSGYNRGGYNQGGYQQGGYQQRRPAGNGSGMRKPPQKIFSKQSFPRPVKYQEIVTDPSAPIRLNKYLANAGVCSRREADEFIQAGVVKVNGETVTELGTKITRLDKVTFHDQSVQIESKIYIVLNKPKNCVTTSDDPQNRQTVMDLVKNACLERIYPVGRLDRNTTGVLLLTNDGEMAAKLTHPSFKKKKIYHVWLDREVAVDDMEKLANGIELEDGEIHADAISYANEEDRSQVGIEIHSGKNRIVRRMFETLGYHVTKLDRVYFAGLTKKNLGRGKWRYLSEQEVNALRMGAYE